MCFGPNPEVVDRDRHGWRRVGPIDWFGASDSDRHFLRSKRGVLPLDEPRRTEADCEAAFPTQHPGKAASPFPGPLCSAGAPGAQTLLIMIASSAINLPDRDTFRNNNLCYRDNLLLRAKMEMRIG